MMMSPSAILAVDAVHQDGVVLNLYEGSQRQSHAPLAVLQQGFVQGLVPQQDWVGHSWGHHRGSACNKPAELYLLSPLGEYMA